MTELLLTIMGLLMARNDLNDEGVLSELVAKLKRLYDMSVDKDKEVTGLTDECQTLGIAFTDQADQILELGSLLAKERQEHVQAKQDIESFRDRGLADMRLVERYVETIDEQEEECDNLKGDNKYLREQFHGVQAVADLLTKKNTELVNTLADEERSTQHFQRVAINNIERTDELTKEKAELEHQHTLLNEEYNYLHTKKVELDYQLTNAKQDAQRYDVLVHTVDKHASNIRTVRALRRAVPNMRLRLAAGIKDALMKWASTEKNPSPIDGDTFSIMPTGLSFETATLLAEDLIDAGMMATIVLL